MDLVAPKRLGHYGSVEQVILLVSDKPIEFKTIVVVKSLLIGLERILKTDLPNISKDFLVVFGYRNLINVFVYRF
jgi:hypothetical protein